MAVAQMKTTARRWRIMADHLPHINDKAASLRLRYVGREMRRAADRYGLMGEFTVEELREVVPFFQGIRLPGDLYDQLRAALAEAERVEVVERQQKADLSGFLDGLRGAPGTMR